MLTSRMLAPASWWNSERVESTRKVGHGRGSVNEKLSLLQHFPMDRYADRLCVAGVATYFGVRTWACVENIDISYPAVIGGPGLTAPRPESWSALGCPRSGLLPAETRGSDLSARIPPSP